jgi:hypothetical protein
MKFVYFVYFCTINHSEEIDGVQFFMVYFTMLSVPPLYSINTHELQRICKEALMAQSSWNWPEVTEENPKKLGIVSVRAEIQTGFPEKKKV